MRALRLFGLALVMVVAVAASWWWFGHRTASPETVGVYYVKADGSTLGRWNVSLGPARDAQSVAFYAAVQAVAGPPADIDAVRFPRGTRVLSTKIDAGGATVDLSSEVGTAVEGSLTEGGEFKALIYTLTALPDVSQVRVRVAGASVATLPGGHLELDEPLTRQSF